MNKMELFYMSDEIGIAEAIIQSDNKTTFAIYKNKEISYRDSLNLADDLQIQPPPISHSLLRNKFISLPPEPIDYGGEEDLFNEVRQFIAKYFEVNERFCDISAIYAITTWVYQDFKELPYLRVIGTFGTGKSRFLKVMEACTYRSIMLGATSVAAMFRTIDRFKGTLLLDEADFKSSEFASEVAKILNNGYAQGMPVARMKSKSNGDYETEIFQVFGPKVMATRESFDDSALESRCFTQHLYPVNKIKAPISLDEEFDTKARELKGKLLMFRFKWLKNLKIEQLEIPKVKNPRILQIVMPVWNIAKLVASNKVQGIIEEAIIMDSNFYLPPFFKQ